MIDFSSDVYNRYLMDQINDSNAGDAGPRYLNFLKEKILKDFDYFKARVLDIGCREFETWDWFIANFGNKITGIDVCKDSLESCKSKNKKCIELDAHRMLNEIQPDSFDLIVAFHSFEHMFDLPLVLDNCYKISGLDAYLFLAVPMPSYNTGRGHWYDIPNEQFMLDLCNKAGFSKCLFSKIFDDRVSFRSEVEMVALLQKVDK